MSSEENRQLVLHYLQLLEQGETEAAIALLATNLDWWVAGNHPGAGKVSRENLVASLRSITATLAEPFRYDIDHVTAEENRVAVACTGVARKKDGGEYRQSYHMLFFVAEGKICGGRPYLDTMAYAQSVHGAQVTYPQR